MLVMSYINRIPCHHRDRDTQQSLVVCRHNPTSSLVLRPSPQHLHLTRTKYYMDGIHKYYGKGLGMIGHISVHMLMSNTQYISIYVHWPGNEAKVHTEP